MSEIPKLPWVQQEAQEYPGLANILTWSTEALLVTAAQIAEADGVLAEEPSARGLGTLVGHIPIAANAHATEQLRIRVTRVSTAAIYVASYVGAMGAVTRPAPLMGVRYRKEDIDDEGELRYWNQAAHSGDDITLALGFQPGILVRDLRQGDLLKNSDRGDLLMRWHLGVAIFQGLTPGVETGLAVSNIPPHTARFQNQ